MISAAELKGRTVLVTGGARRIGRAICERLAGEGVHVAFSFRKSAVEAEETRKALEARGARALAVRVDLSRLADCDLLLEQALSLTGKVDILVNNASEFPRTPLADLEKDPCGFEERFRSLAGIHMQAPFYLGMKLGLLMKASGWGRIVNILDRVIVRGQAYSNWPLYLITKYGLYGVNQVLAQELAPEVCVNGIAPGLVLPPEDFPEEETAKVLARIPLRREAGVEEIAEDVLHLIRSGSKTGSLIVTDGGAGLRTF